MASVTHLTPLNFNDGIIGKKWIDKKTGLEISIGFVSGLPGEIADISYESGDVALGLLDAGIGQKELDQACQKLHEDAEREDFELLVTKSDFPFDSRWYIIGHINQLFDAAARDRIALPFSNFLYDEIDNELKFYSRHKE